ncbi:MAG: serine/threonine-protein kinase [Planctomycetota bacterium]
MNETMPPHRPLGGPDGSDRPDVNSQSETREISPRKAPGNSAGAGRDRSGALGAYPIEAKIGEGGMGKVYRCLDPTLMRHVAVKVLHEKYGEDPRYRARFLREARTVASLSHPNVAQVFSVETNDGDLSLVMEYVSGRSLDDRLEDDGAFSGAEALKLILQSAHGLDAALQRGVIHRDVKPSNILVDEHGNAKIVDFGLAKELGSNNSITDEGIVLGTPQYISPEQGRGQAVDQRSDIYSLGATFYHLLTGRPPFDQKSQIAVIVAHVQETPQAPHILRPDLSPSLSAIVGKMMATDLETRYANYQDLIEDLEAAEKGSPLVHAKLDEGRFEADATSADKAPRDNRWWITIAATVALLTVATIVIVQSGARASVSRPKNLGAWLHSTESSDLLRLNFKEPPRQGALDDVLFLLEPVDDGVGRVKPTLLSHGLTWTNYVRPVAVNYSFERIDHIEMRVTRHRGRFDLGLAVVDPRGSSRRSLTVTLRSVEQRQGSPVLALRGNRPIAVHDGSLELPVPPQGFEFSLAFVVESTEGTPRTKLRIRLSSLEKTSRFVSYDHAVYLDGDDWNRGAFVFVSRPLRMPFQATVSQLSVSGRLDGRKLRYVPWHD